MKSLFFDPSKHVFSSPILEDVIQDAVEFFVNTPVYDLPPPKRFKGPGVYALYYVGDQEPYSRLGERNRKSVDIPIYVGQASPKGVRQARVEEIQEAVGYRLWNRLGEHRRNIEQVSNLRRADFKCRFMLMLDEEMGIIRTVESALIWRFRPLWNTYIDGFGIHDPGAGRAKQLQSEWDSIHPGRNFVAKMESSPRPLEPILAKIRKVLDELD